MKIIPSTDNALLLRTDFTNDTVWEEICRAATANDKGFIAYVECCNVREFDSITVQQIMNSLTKDYEHSFLFIADNISMIHKDRPFLCVDLNDQSYRTIRVIPSAMWIVENNLSIANMDFEEFMDCLDSEGIFRGFEQL